jgi:DNA-binding MarR family transcriptional regulator
VTIITVVGESAIPPGELLAGSVGFLLSKLGFHSAARFAHDLAPIGIDPRQFALLRYVAADEGQSQQALGAALQVPPSAMVALIDEMEARGLVERRRNPHDRRAHALHLTAKGRRLFDKANGIATDYEARLCGSLSAAERQRLLELLQRIAADEHTPIGVHPGLTQPHPHHRGA